MLVVKNLDLEFRHLDIVEESQLLSWIQSVRSPMFDWTFEKLSELNDIRIFVGISEGGGRSFIAYRMNVDAIEIIALATQPGMGRQGIMIQTYTAWLEVLGQKKLNQKAIWLEVHEDNAPALNLYLKLGFQETGRRPKYYKDQKSAILMTKALPRHGK